MKKTIFTLLLMVFLCQSAIAQFDKFFYPKTMRYDYYHAGDSKTELFFFSKLVEEPYWAGSKTQLIDKLEYGNHFFKIYDIESSELIYSRGFCTLFNEWQDTPEAKILQRAHPESIVFPFPKSKVRVEIYTRNDKNIFEKKHSQDIDPNSYNIEKQTAVYDSFDVLYNGHPSKKVDIALIAEGYTETEREKFKNDCVVFMNSIFTFSPFKEQKENFNIKAVWSKSNHSGVSIPGENIWKNTAVGAKFYTFNSERYQMTDDLQKVRNVASAVPYDVIYIISNTPKYGGGGVYNYYGISAADNKENSAKIYVHEFGHLFLGLGDEYSYGGESLDMYSRKVEPWEENLTTLANFDKKAIWKKHLQKGVAIPTPINSENQNIVGVFQGAGYFEEGVYRPVVNCLMRSFTTEHFCPVCSDAIIQMISTYTK